MFIIIFQDKDELAEAVGLPDYKTEEELMCLAKKCFPTLQEVELIPDSLMAGR